jgi:hypothetical protein
LFAAKHYEFEIAKNITSETVCKMHLLENTAKALEMLIDYDSVTHFIAGRED